jgi:beta-galactosidase
MVITMYYGVSYYPEHKTKEELEHDLKLLKESGINTVRMGEFAWCRFEPVEGEYHFEWLDKVVEELGKWGIKTIICTPTACPPAWLVEKEPELLYTDNRGIKRPFGGRRHYCYNHEGYREASRRIAGEVGKHYGRNPYVAGFQIDNEPAQEGTGRCTCPVCREKFRNWLKKKYKTIEAFNERSGGIFWSQEYNSFHQINPPVNTIEVGAIQSINAFYENPTIRLEFERFSSDSQIEYQDIQTETLRAYTTLPVTTNGTGLATNSIDYYKSTKALSNYAFDYYPGLRDQSVDSFPYAFARGVKEGAPFWVLEFMSGGGHRLSGSGRLQPNPGALKQAVLQSFAHGADMMLHFQFRSFPIGAEQLNYAIVDLDGVPRRRYFEMQETAKELKQLEKLGAAEFKNQAAICFDYDTHWALRIKPVNDPVYHYLNYCTAFYKTLSEAGVNADVISLEQDFNRYKLLILPSAFLLKKTYRKKLKDYVKQGGILIATFLTSVKNEDNVGYTETLPAGLTDLFGVTVEEVEPVFDRNKTSVRLTTKAGYKDSADSMWSELLAATEDKTALFMASYLEDYKTGAGIFSKNAYGEGFAYYLGTELDKETMGDFLTEICTEHGLARNPITAKGAGEGLEVVHRVYEGKDLYYVFNFSSKELKIDCLGSYRDCLRDEMITNSCVIERNGYRVLLMV